jgi:hypothetical protein
VIKVVWVAGYATTPNAIKKAAIDLVVYWWNQRGTLGKAALTSGGQSVTPRDEQMPATVKETLAPYMLEGVLT